MSKGYQLKITIKGSKPPIWRRVIIPDGITFRDLDNIIEEIFGWEHGHLFEFCFNREECFTGSPMPEEDDTVDVWVDGWIEEGGSFTYVYDFGDYWVHNIKVEKIMERQERFPVVLKSKGSYLIEDCGGIWGFYDYIEEAVPFDIGLANERLCQMVFPEPDGTEGPENYLHMQKDDLIEAENHMRSLFPVPESLAEIFMHYSKDEMCQIARFHHFSKYSKFKKAELAQWLKNHLLETVYMKNMLMKTSLEELVLFERAMDKGGILIPEALLESSLFLSTYAGFYSDFEFLQVPRDVAEKYRKICTPEFRRNLWGHQEAIRYCSAAVYLYGAVSKEEIQEISRHYTGEDIAAALLDEAVASLCQDNWDEYVFKDGMLMDRRLAAQDAYLLVKKMQGSFPRYFPEEKEDMLSYGRIKNHMFTEENAFFVDYIQKRFKLDEDDAMGLYMEAAEAIRMHQEDETFFELFMDFGCQVNSQKKTKELFDNIKKLSHYVRRWELNGHTEEEAMPQSQAALPGQESKPQNKVIPFPNGKKVYPNDPCPCGSGKKYKHCCGKK